MGLVRGLSVEPPRSAAPLTRRPALRPGSPPRPSLGTFPTVRVGVSALESNAKAPPFQAYPALAQRGWEALREPGPPLPSSTSPRGWPGAWPASHVPPREALGSGVPGFSLWTAMTLSRRSELTVTPSSLF